MKNQSAYPHWSGEDQCGNQVNQAFGLSKRELFSAMAMQGILSHTAALTSEETAKLCVICADALIKELSK